MMRNMYSFAINIIIVSVIAAGLACMEKKEITGDEKKQLQDVEELNKYIREEGWPFDNRRIKKVHISGIRERHADCAHQGE